MRIEERHVPDLGRARARWAWGAVCGTGSRRCDAYSKCAVCVSREGSAESLSSPQAEMGRCEELSRLVLDFVDFLALLPHSALRNSHYRFLYVITPHTSPGGAARIGSVTKYLLESSNAKEVCGRQSKNKRQNVSLRRIERTANRTPHPRGSERGHATRHDGQRRQERWQGW